MFKLPKLEKSTDYNVKAYLRKDDYALLSLTDRPEQVQLVFFKLGRSNAGKQSRSSFPHVFAPSWRRKQLSSTMIRSPPRNFGRNTAAFARRPTIILLLTLSTVSTRCSSTIRRTAGIISSPYSWVSSMKLARTSKTLPPTKTRPSSCVLFPNHSSRSQWCATLYICNLTMISTQLTPRLSVKKTCTTRPLMANTRS